MKPASIKQIKTELENLLPEQLLVLCMNLVKYKKENKELATYLLFEANNEILYIKEVKKNIDEIFEQMNTSNLYLAKKTLRKALRTTNKFIKYSDKKQSEIELRIYFCQKMKKSKLKLIANTVVGNMYQGQIQRINKTLKTLHEDLQFDYLDEIKAL